MVILYNLGDNWRPLVLFDLGTQKFCMNLHWTHILWDTLKKIDQNPSSPQHQMKCYPPPPPPPYPYKWRHISEAGKARDNSNIEANFQPYQYTCNKKQKENENYLYKNRSIFYNHHSKCLFKIWTYLHNHVCISCLDFLCRMISQTCKFSSLIVLNYQ